MWTLDESKVSGASRVWSGTLNTDFEFAANWNLVVPPSAPVNDTTTDIGVFSGFGHEVPDRVVRQEQRPDLLFDQVG